jgi:hypothetical protein
VQQATRAEGATSEHLRRKIGLLLPDLVAVGNRLLEHPRVGELYPEYLFTSHCIIRASVPLMETARSRALEQADDPVCEALVVYFDEHIPEELDHDEWLLGDLELLGVERASVLARPPAPTVASLVGAQYYWILHFHPVALLGYIALFEGYPPSVEMVDRLAASTGYDRAAFRTMLAHAELDPGHREELDRLLDSLPLTPEQSAVMGLSAMWSTHLFTRALDEVVSER